MVSLYEEPEKPSNAIDYIKKYLGAAQAGANASEYDKLKKENEDLKIKIKGLENQIGALRIENEGEV